MKPRSSAPYVIFVMTPICGEGCTELFNMFFERKLAPYCDLKNCEFMVDLYNDREVRIAQNMLIGLKLPFITLKKTPSKWNIVFKYKVHAFPPNITTRG